MPPIPIELMSRLKELNEALQTGRAIPEEFASGLAEELFAEGAALLADEQERSIAWGRENGVDTLTTDSSGTRSADWFRQTGKAFATGIASTCFAFGIAHPEIGMAAAHLNTVTHDDITAAIIRNLRNPQFRDALRTLPDAERHQLLVSPRSLGNTVAKALDSAFAEFGSITAGGIPQEGTIMFTCGLNWLNPQDIDRVDQGVLSFVRSQPLMNDGQFLGRSRGINFQSFLGQSGGVIYGGQYRNPSFYQIR